MAEHQFLQMFSRKTVFIFQGKAGRTGSGIHFRLRVNRTVRPDFPQKAMCPRESDLPSVSPGGDGLSACRHLEGSHSLLLCVRAQPATLSVLWLLQGGQLRSPKDRLTCKLECELFGTRVFASSRAICFGAPLTSY